MITRPMTGLEFRRAVRHPAGAYNGTLGYGPLVLVMTDGELMCFQCAVKERTQICCAAMNRNAYHDGWAPHSFTIIWEGPSNFCCNCNKEMPTEYGDPDAPSAD